MRWRPNALWMVDLAGGALVCVLAACAAWHVFLRPSSAAAQLSTLGAALTEKARDTGLLEFERAKQQVLLAERQEALRAHGAPQAESPVEDHLRTVAELARRNEVRLGAVTPVGAVSYPGVREVRYHVEARGSYAALAALLRQFETCTFWGDITHLQLGRPKNAPGEVPEDRELDLTVCFYSAEAPTSRPKDAP
jgi:hypothetical protein